MPVPNISDVNKLLIECACHGCHYLKVDYFDTEEDPFVFGLIGQFTSLPSLLRDWWRGHDNYVHCIVLNVEEMDALIASLKKLRKKAKTVQKMCTD